MTFQEAEILLNLNKNLIGTLFNEKKITHLIIVPIQKDNLGLILSNINLDSDYSNLLIGYDDFDVLALLDFDQYPNIGSATSVSVNVICDKLS